MEAEALEKHLKKTTITSNVVSLLVALLVAVGTGYGFYYNTKTTLSQHSIDIKDIKQDVNVIKQDMTSTAIFKGMTEAEQKNLQDRLTRIEASQDKMLEILSTIKFNQQNSK
jgi:hypothetical protein